MVERVEDLLDERLRRAEEAENRVSCHRAGSRRAKRQATLTLGTAFAMMSLCKADMASAITLAFLVFAARKMGWYSGCEVGGGSGMAARADLRQFRSGIPAPEGRNPQLGAHPRAAQALIADSTASTSCAPRRLPVESERFEFSEHSADTRQSGRTRRGGTYISDV